MNFCGRSVLQGLCSHCVNFRLSRPWDYICKATRFTWSRCLLAYMLITCKACLLKRTKLETAELMAKRNGFAARNGDCVWRCLISCVCSAAAVHWGRLMPVSFRATHGWTRMIFLGFYHLCGVSVAGCSGKALKIVEECENAQGGLWWDV